MSIFSKIGNKVKSIAKSVYSTVNNVGNTLSKAIGLGTSSSNTASALQGTYIPPKSGAAYGTPAYYSSSPTYLKATSGLAGTNTSALPSQSPQPATSYKSLQTPTPSGGGYSSGSSAPMQSSYDTSSYNPQASTGSFSSFQAPSSISVGTQQLSSPSAIIPSTPGGTNYQGAIVGNNVGLGANPANGLMPVNGQQLDQNGNPVADKTQNPLEEYLRAEKDPRANVDIAGAYNKAQSEGGLQQAQQQRNNSQNAINAVTTKMNTDLLQLRGTASAEGVTEAVYGGQQAQITREATITLLPLQAQLAADQNNLELAQSHTDTLFKMYSQEAQQSADNWNRQAKAVYEYATTSEKRKLDEVAKDKEYLRNTIDSESKNQQTIANELLKAGNMAGYKAVTGVRPPSNVNSPTYAKDFANYKADLNNVISQHGRSIGALDRQQQQAQIDASNRSNRPTVPTGKYNPAQDKQIDQINTGVSNSFTYKAVNSAKGFADGVLASLQQKNGLSDVAAINQFQKVIDEGAVTRDQDVKLVQQSQSLVNSLKLKVNKLQKGEQLSSQQRAEMSNTVKSLYEAKVRALTDDPYIKSQVKKAKQNGIDSTDTIIGELGVFSDQPSSGQSSQSNPEQELINAGYTPEQIKQIKNAK